MRNLIVNADTLIVFLLSLFPPAGLATAAFAALLRRAWFFTPAWLLLWLGFGTPLALHQLLFGRGSSSTEMILLLLSGVAAATLLGVRRKALIAGSCLALFVFLFAGAADLALSALTWQAYDERTNLSTLWRPFHEALDARSTRAWSLPPALPESEVRLSFEARLLSGTPDWNWHRSTPEFRLEALTDEGEPYTRVQTPSGSDPYLMRTYTTTPGPVGGERLRATVTLRAERPIPASGNRGIWLQAQGEKLYLKTLPVALTTRWQTFVLDWTPPASVENSVIHLVLNDFDGLNFDVKDASLEIFRRGVWGTLGPPSPTGTSVTLGLEGRPADAASIRFTPTSTWQTYRLETDLETVQRDALSSQVRATLTLEPGLVIEVRRTRLEAPGAEAQPRPLLGGFRSPLWFGHPNLAGHAAVTVGLVFLAFTRSGWLGLGGLFVTLLCVWTTGSRAAWLAALLGLPWLLWLTCRPKARIKVFGALFAVVALFLFGLGLSSLGRLQLIGVDELVSRPDIWRTAWDAFLVKPLTGIGPGGFADYWWENKSQPIVTHAHNLWLQFAAAYGLPGLVAILWLTGGFLLLAWRWGRWRGLALVVPVFVMNTFDYTFFYSGVLFPLLLGMNALREERGKTALAAPPPATERA